MDLLAKEVFNDKLHCYSVQPTVMSALESVRAAKAILCVAKTTSAPVQLALKLEQLLAQG